MSEGQRIELCRPWLVTGWPGMGNVALNACVYLLSKLDMELLAELSADDLFDIDHVEVRQGLVRRGRRARNRFFVWKDPKERHDLVVFLGEAQPPIGKYAFCRQLIAYAKELGIERLFAFAAMATAMHPQQASRVFVAATNQESSTRLYRLELEILGGRLYRRSQRSGSWGRGRSGHRWRPFGGEIPHLFSQLPFPKASLAILEKLTTLMGIEMDFTELGRSGRGHGNPAFRVPVTNGGGERGTISRATGVVQSGT
ncbi:MAG: PAC2 family protein [Planctomycetota bacterium]